MSLPSSLRTDRLELLVSDPGAAVGVADYFRRNLEWLQKSSPTFPASITTVEHWEAKLAHQQRLAKEGGELRFFLKPHGEERIVGTVSLTEIARGPLQQCLLGFGLDQGCTGRGLMREALEAVMRHAFQRLKLMKVRADYLPTNHASARVLSRLGFVIEGRAERHVCIAGRWEDHILAALLNPQPELVEAG